METSADRGTRATEDAGARSRTPVGADPLEEAYVRNVGPALRLAYFLTGDRDQAQDLAHEAFVRMAGRLRHRRGIDDTDAYLRRTIVNLFTSSLRHRRVERAWLARQTGARATVPPPEDDPAERDELWRALRGLPERQRAAVVLRYYEDLSEHDAAAILGCSSRALNGLVARAMSTLRAELPEGDDA
jgi:RNA polymerase sigma-70 factor (sigma-E family)